MLIAHILLKDITRVYRRLIDRMLDSRQAVIAKLEPFILSMLSLAVANVANINTL
jgi:hypothetical protein